ncbi:Eclosion hormone [Amphibalanus amphitrite]|uniref:Eclosion hormone n=1 Tax=Amphibalanus amphitrite TaxID=1232801 RepID=A0A6A4WXR1_AMPAM|nr:Eclosion hormone [Amphibalanus amphitrite]
MFHDRWETESLLVLCGAIAVLLLSGPAQASIGSCVRNCGQCKSMYGRFFQGTACADACLAGNEGPDCYNPSMVSRFLKRRASPVVPASPGLASLGGKYEYYSVDGQPAEAPISGSSALFRMLSARGVEARK